MGVYQMAGGGWARMSQPRKWGAGRPKLEGGNMGVAGTLYNQQSLDGSKREQLQYVEEQERYNKHM